VSSPSNGGAKGLLREPRSFENRKKTRPLVWASGTISVYLLAISDFSLLFQCVSAGAYPSLISVPVFRNWLLQKWKFGSMKRTLPSCPHAKEVPSCPLIRLHGNRSSCQGRKAGGRYTRILFSCVCPTHTYTHTHTHTHTHTFTQTLAVSFLG
jgi:hypothetical protein